MRWPSRILITPSGATSNNQQQQQQQQYQSDHYPNTYHHRQWILCRDLYNSISNGNFPTWTMYIQVILQKKKQKKFFKRIWPTLMITYVFQVMTFEEAENWEFNPFDLTKVRNISISKCFQIWITTIGLNLNKVQESVVCKFTVCHNLTKSRNLVASSCQIQIFTIWPDFPPLHIWQQDKADRAILKSDFDRNQPLSISASEIFVNLHLCFIWFSWFSLDCSTLLCHCQKIGFRLEKEGRFAGCHLKLLTFTYLQELLVVIAIKLSEFILWDIFSTYIGIQMYKEIFT